MIDVVVLAAGASKRFGSDKLLTDVSGRPLLAVTLGAVRAQQVPAERVVVVVPAGDVGRTGEREQIARAAGVRIARSEHAVRGMRWSIHAGLDAVDARASGAVVVLADDPLSVGALEAVLDRAKQHPERAVAVRRSVPAPHPVYLPRVAWPKSPTEDDDRGLRALLDIDVDWLELPGSPSCDVDAPPDADHVARLV